MAKHLVIARGSPLDAAATAAAQRAPERTVRVLKSAVSAATLNDAVWAADLADYRMLAGGFVESLRSASVFDRLLADGARRVSLRTRVVVDDRWCRRCSRRSRCCQTRLKGDAASGQIDARKAATLIVISEELARSPSAEAFSLASSVSVSRRRRTLNFYRGSSTPQHRSWPGRLMRRPISRARQR